MRYWIIVLLAALATAFPASADAHRSHHKHHHHAKAAWVGQGIEWAEWRSDALAAGFTPQEAEELEMTPEEEG